MRVLIFTEGTILVHQSSKNKTRAKIVQQIIDKDISVSDYKNYIPIKNAVATVKNILANGYDVYYLTSRKTDEEVSQIKSVLDKYDFPQGVLYNREDGEEYIDVVKRVKPDFIIEDDCESIGGYNETIKNQMENSDIKFINVKEFGGIDKIKLPL